MMPHEQAVAIAARPIIQHVKAWGGTWTPARVAESFRTSFLGGGAPWYQFRPDAIYVNDDVPLPDKVTPGTVRVTYAEAIAAAEGRPAQMALW